MTLTDDMSHYIELRRQLKISFTFISQKIITTMLQRMQIHCRDVDWLGQALELVRASHLKQRYMKKLKKEKNLVSSAARQFGKKSINQALMKNSKTLPSTRISIFL